MLPGRRRTKQGANPFRCAAVLGVSTDPRGWSPLRADLAGSGSPKFFAAGRRAEVGPSPRVVARWTATDARPHHQGRGRRDGAAAAEAEFGGPTPMRAGGASEPVG
ncbi:hypothetical protein NL676_021914 [Syzygium grande]|nr:hypothetical protein NL676_021914 [Syzygium grande]